MPSIVRPTNSSKFGAFIAIACLIAIGLTSSTFILGWYSIDVSEHDEYLDATTKGRSMFAIDEIRQEIQTRPDNDWRLSTYPALKKTDVQYSEVQDVLTKTIALMDTVKYINIAMLTLLAMSVATLFITRARRSSKMEIATILLFFLFSLLAFIATFCLLYLPNRLFEEYIKEMVILREGALADAVPTRVEHQFVVIQHKFKFVDKQQYTTPEERTYEIEYGPGTAWYISLATAWGCLLTCILAVLERRRRLINESYAIQAGKVIEGQPPQYEDGFTTRKPKMPETGEAPVDTSNPDSTGGSEPTK